MNTKTYRVLLVEDDPACRERLARAIKARSELVLLADVGSLQEAMAWMEGEHPDVLVVDIGLPDGNGLDLIRACKRREDCALCLVITIYGDEAHVLEALAAGAVGYLLKDAPLSDLGEAIVSAIGGGVPISPGIARALLAYLHPPADQSKFDSEAHLSPRETEVLEYLARGYTRAEIAGVLHLSINTIGIHFNFNNIFNQDGASFLSIFCTMLFLISLFLFSHRMMLSTLSIGLSLYNRLTALLLAILFSLPLLLYLADLQIPVLQTLLISIIYLSLFDLFVDDRSPGLTWLMIWICAVAVWLLFSVSVQVARNT